MEEFKSFYKKVSGNEGNKCRYSTRLDLYGRGCEHNCAYCYAKSLLEFRGLWNPDDPAVADIEKVKRKIARIEPGSVVRLGGMTDCFQPAERKYGVTRAAIEALNSQRVHYLIVTKSDLICDYMHILDRDLAHVQVSTTWIPYENAVSTEKRISAVETLQENGFDVAVRLSPYIPQFVNYDQLNSIKCDKLQIEFLRVNHWIKKWLPIDYSEYTLYQSGYWHLPLARKMSYMNNIRFKEVSVCEDESGAYEWFKLNLNWNPNDCCNLRR